MKTYHFIYTEPAKVNQLMIVTSLLFISGLLVALFAFHLFLYIPVWLLFFCFFTSYIGTLFYFKQKIIAVECEVTKTDRAFLIELCKTNFLYKKKEIILNINVIKNIASNFDSISNGIGSFLIHFIDRSSEVKLIYPNTRQLIVLEDFAYIVNSSRDQYQKSLPAKIHENLKQQNLYHSLGSKIFTYGLFIILPFFTLFFILLDDISWSTAFEFYGFCALWFLGYFFSSKK